MIEKLENIKTRAGFRMHDIEMTNKLNELAKAFNDLEKRVEKIEDWIPKIPN